MPPMPTREEIKNVLGAFKEIMAVVNKYAYMIPKNFPESTKDLDRVGIILENRMDILYKALKGREEYFGY